MSIHQINPSYAETKTNYYGLGKSKNQTHIVTVIYGFDIATNELLQSQHLAKRINGLLSEYQTGYDEFYNKPQAEYLIFAKLGAVDKPKKLIATVNGKTKTILQQPNRKFVNNGFGKYKIENSDGGSALLSYVNAYGGAKYNANPFGKGYLEGNAKEIPMPIFESIDKQVQSPIDKLEPVSFASINPSADARKKYIGKMTKEEQKEYRFTNNLPASLSPEFFMMSAKDQWLGSLNPGSSFKLDGFGKVPISGVIPPYIATITTKDINDNIAQHDGKIDTLALFPQEGVGVVITKFVFDLPTSEFTDRYTHILTQLNDSDDKYTLAESTASLEARLGENRQNVGLKEDDLMPKSMADKKQDSDEVQESLDKQELASEELYDDIFGEFYEEIEHLPKFASDIDLDYGVVTSEYIDELFNHPPSLADIGEGSRQTMWDALAHDSFKNMAQELISGGWSGKTIDSLTFDSGIDFKGLNAVKTAIIHCTFDNGDFTDASFIDGRVGHTTFTKCNFIGSNFNVADFRYCEFIDCTFDKATFTRTTIKDCEFNNCTFTGCIFDSSKVQKVDFIDGSIENSSFDVDTWLDVALNGTSLVSNNLNKVQFTEVQILSVELTDNSINKAVFHNSLIRDSKLMNNVWLSCGLAKGNVLDTLTMSNETMQGCNFKNSVWNSVVSEKMNIYRHDMSEAIVTSSTFKEMKGYSMYLVNSYLTDTKILQSDLPHSHWVGTTFDRDSKITDNKLNNLVSAHIDTEIDTKELMKQIEQDTDVQQQVLDYPDIRKGLPKVKSEIKTDRATVAGITAGGTYRYYGNISLNGEMEVTDNDATPLSNYDLPTRKSHIETQIANDIKQMIANRFNTVPDEMANTNIYDVVADFDAESKTVSLTWKFGNYSFKPEVFIYRKRDIYIKGSITKDNNNVVVDNRFEVSSSLTIDVEMTFMSNGQEAGREQIDYLKNFVKGMAFTLELTGTAISILPHPAIKGIGLGIKTGGKVLDRVYQ